MREIVRKLSLMTALAAGGWARGVVTALARGAGKVGGLVLGGAAARRGASRGLRIRLRG